MTVQMGLFIMRKQPIQRQVYPDSLRRGQALGKVVRPVVRERRRRQKPVERDRKDKGVGVRPVVGQVAEVRLGMMLRLRAAVAHDAVSSFWRTI